MLSVQVLERSYDAQGSMHGKHTFIYLKQTNDVQKKKNLCLQVINN